DRSHRLAHEHAGRDRDGSRLRARQGRDSREGDRTGKDASRAPGARRECEGRAARPQGERDRICPRPLGWRGRSPQRGRRDGHRWPCDGDRASLKRIERRPRMSAAPRQLERFDNLISLFLTRASEKGDKPFLWSKRDGEWRSISWAEAARQVAALAASLKRIGLEPGDRVALVSENRPEWLISDLAIMAAGCVTVPTY